MCGAHESWKAIGMECEAGDSPNFSSLIMPHWDNVIKKDRDLCDGEVNNVEFAATNCSRGRMWIIKGREMNKLI